MLVFETKLPPRGGYVEVEQDGERVYRKITKPEDERYTRLASETDVILDLLADHEYRLCMSELNGGETTK
nr:MAG TPA: hypothetical protein [Caudoviricetes sp.]